MRRLLLAGIALAVLAGAAVVSRPAGALENCSVVTATADGRNRDVAADRAQRRLHHYVARNLSSLTGKTVSHVTTHCIRTVCESRAIVCQH